MNKIKATLRVNKVVIVTVVIVILLMAFWALCNFVIKQPLVLSDEGLSTIGLALSTSLGVLTAIVVSFVLITWQSSRQERSTSFWRWRNASLQLEDFFDAKVEVLSEITEEVIKLTWASAKVALVAPMPRNEFVELSNKVSNKVIDMSKKLQGIKEPSKEEVAKGRAYMDITNYLVDLATANFEHRLSHDLYPRVLSLRGLLYRLLTALVASIFVVAIGVTTTPVEVSDIFNAPVAILLIGLFIYVLGYLAREIKSITHLEEQFRKTENA